MVSFYDVDALSPRRGRQVCRIDHARGTMLAERCDLSQSVVGRHFKLKEMLLDVNKRDTSDRDIPSNLRWLLVRSRVTVEYEAVSAGAPGAASFRATSKRCTPTRRCTTACSAAPRPTARST